MKKIIRLIEIQKMRSQFLREFNRDWETFLLACEPNLSGAQQLHIGNHIRPQLVCWGFMINKNLAEYSDYSKISRLAVSVEAVHKASVIIDDIIDGDTKRRGQDCMHREFGEYPTVFFAVCMLAVLRRTELDIHLHGKYALRYNSRDVPRRNCGDIRHCAATDRLVVCSDDY